MKPIFIALAFLLVAAAMRLAASFEISLVNFSPLMALALCGGIYLRARAAWLLPLGILITSDILLNLRYGSSVFGAGEFLRYACYAAAIGIGFAVARRKSWTTIAAGSLGCAVLFYLVTNTGSWLMSPGYVKTGAGWWQALTVGHPGFPPTLLFFRNSLISDLVFTGLFAVTMEWQARRAGLPSLLGSPAPAATRPAEDPVG